MTLAEVSRSDEKTKYHKNSHGVMRIESQADKEI
jgi:hypothetical protein